MGVIHNLKILPEYFIPVAEKRKTFEIRKNDRDYQVNDTLHLMEWYNGYTGREINVRVKYIFQDEAYGLQEGYCVMSIEAKEE